MSTSLPQGEIEQVLSALSSAGVKYVVAGGVAVVLHGHMRLTRDLDLIVDLEHENALRCIDALGTLDYRPRAPVPAQHFADPEKRAEWSRDKGMMVFSLWSTRLPSTEVDLFTEPLLPFDEAIRNAVTVEIGEMSVRVLAIDDLIRMKKAAGRPQDLLDIAALERIQTGEAP